MDNPIKHLPPSSHSQGKSSNISRPTEHLLPPSRRVTASPPWTTQPSTCHLPHIIKASPPTRPIEHLLPPHGGSSKSSMYNPTKHQPLPHIIRKSYNILRPTEHLLPPFRRVTPHEQHNSYSVVHYPTHALPPQSIQTKQPITQLLIQSSLESYNISNLYHCCW